jgi:beta-aspartyl-peptidase (threonine type)
MVSNPMPRSPVNPAIIVHGGAGDIADSRAGAVTAGCDHAARCGLAVLAAGGAALDAAQAAVRALEDDPEFNAGVGAVLSRTGTVELDAAVMDGRTLGFGAVAAMADARQPIDIARAVLDDGEHALLCADGAWAFARARGFRPCAPDALITRRARDRLAAAAASAGRAVGERDPGTVGACAIDARGHVAAATSTGGMTFKRPGRIGDTPLCGCGTYADDRAGAASATGEGEAIIRTTLARVCADAIRAGASAREAAWTAVAELERVGGSGGIICVGRDGRLGAAHNSRRMSFAAGAVAGATPTILGSGVSAGRGLDLDAPADRPG